MSRAAVAEDSWAIRPQKLDDITLGRVQAYTRQKHLLKSKIYHEDTIPVTMNMVAVEGRPLIGTFALPDGNAAPAKVGTELGPPWSTHWILVTAELPSDWLSKPVDLCFDCNTAEVLTWGDGGGGRGGGG